jgi:hypothetical protein
MDNDPTVYSVNSDEAFAQIHKVIRPDQLMMEGLCYFYTHGRIHRSRRSTNIKRFEKKFGLHPVVAVRIWEDLQTTGTVSEDKLNSKYFLMSLHHLRKYPTEDDRESIWDVSPKTGREWVWFYLEALQDLKYVKIVWPDDWGPDIWIITVDGTHCWIHEPQHPEWSQDREYYSHKYAKAGIDYELGISIATSRLVWMNGPFKAGQNDARIFRDHGLRNRLRAIGKKAIGDRGYQGYHNECSTYNPHDSRNVKKFKSRALKRHETFNFMTKSFRCLDGRFRHSPARFATCFEAVCVICQYKLEHNVKLYDVLIEDLM